MLQKGLLISVNSDDPAYNGAYIGENLYNLAVTVGLSISDIVTLAKNSFI